MLANIGMLCQIVFGGGEAATGGGSNGSFFVDKFDRGEMNMSTFCPGGDEEGSEVGGEGSEILFNPLSGSVDERYEGSYMVLLE